MTIIVKNSIASNEILSSKLKVNVEFGKRLQSYTVTNTQLYNCDIFAKYQSCKKDKVSSYYWRLNDLQKDRPNLHILLMLPDSNHNIKIVC